MAFILMSSWLLLVSFLPSCYSDGTAQYECGPHGRFEYCIDGIPGCVIGCHCHPGYYFDTDTKVCEPNIKLTQEFRRNYLPEPTRIHHPVFDSQIATTDLSPTITNPVDAKIDEITKDADDLGDWLYNQFFKTIENQVINSTGDNEQVLTRRSGSVVKEKPKRRSRKHLKKRGKKSKRKKSGLKRKLLRITEDDSLFDSSSGSNTDEDSSSSSSESDTDTSFDSFKNDKDHGHKKIIIFNKKQKPPLPSFIFLPNMETPFYPPIGLPPPPVIPMYPFVPVPPVAPVLSYPGFTPQCDENETSTTVSPSTSTATSITTGSTSGTTTTLASITTGVSSSELASSTTKTANETITPNPNLRARDPSLYGKTLRSKNKLARRNKLKLKEKINRRQKLPQINASPDDYPDMEEPLLETMPKPYYSKQMQSNAIEEEMPREDVDFKYLTELIHRVDLNNTRKPGPFPMNPTVPGGRRNYYTAPYYLSKPVHEYRIEEPHRSRINKLDDTYYSSLGREIASMIRKIDTHGDRQIDIEIEKENLQTPVHPVFSENSHASRSFWERSVRSPLKTYFAPHDSKFTYLKHSNENLFNLENKVEVAVTTNLPLSLREIENIINKMEHTPVAVKKINDSVITMPSRKLNINLLLTNPQATKPNNKVNLDTVRYENVPPRDNFYRFLLNNNQKPTLSTLIPTIKTDIYKVVFRNKTPTRKPPRTFDNNALKIPRMGNLKFRNNLPTITTTKRPIIYHSNPILFNNKKSNFYTNNQYMYEKTSYPFYFSTIFRNSNQPMSHPSKQSYFHHELHHFDYFDE